MHEVGKAPAGSSRLHDSLDNLPADDFEGHGHWWRLVEHIVQLEELIADMKTENDDDSAIMVRKLAETLRQKRSLLKSIDVG